MEHFSKTILTICALTLINCKIASAATAMAAWGTTTDNEPAPNQLVINYGSNTLHAYSFGHLRDKSNIGQMQFNTDTQKWSQESALTSEVNTILKDMAPFGKVGMKYDENGHLALATANRTKSRLLNYVLGNVERIELECFFWEKKSYHHHSTLYFYPAYAHHKLFTIREGGFISALVPLDDCVYEPETNSLIHRNYVKPTGGSIIDSFCNALIPTTISTVLVENFEREEGELVASLSVSSQQASFTLYQEQTPGQTLRLLATIVPPETPESRWHITPAIIR